MPGAVFDVHTLRQSKDGEEEEEEQPGKYKGIGGSVYTLKGCGQCQSWELAPCTCCGKTLGIHICMRCCWGVPVWSVVAFRCCSVFEKEDEAIYCGVNMVPSVNLRIKIPKEDGGEPEIFVWGDTCQMIKETTQTMAPPETQTMDTM